MNGLYKKVLKGAYPEIPKKYTKDLSDVIMKMLSVEPRFRPSCESLLEMEQIRKRMPKLFPTEEPRDIVEYDEPKGPNAENELLNTIKVPQNLA